MKLGLQLYTLREYTETIGFEAVLRKAAAFGFDGVEFANFGSEPPAEELRSYLDRYGLEVCSYHAFGDALTTNLDRTIEYNRILGNRDIVCCFAPTDTEEHFSETAEMLRSAGERLRDCGMQLHYHNHEVELWDRIDGERVLDRLFRLLPPDIVRPEADVCWFRFGGVDPVEYTKKYARIATRLHIKDAVGPVARDAEEHMRFTVAGEGDVGIAEVIRAARGSAVEWLVYENDRPEPEAFYNVGRSADNLRAMMREQSPSQN